MAQAADSNTTNVVRLPTAAAERLPRVRINTMRAAIRRGEATDLSHVIWARRDADRRRAALDAKPEPSGEKIWVQVDSGLWRTILGLGKF